jgi:O-antigen/teichoic acid export membrane protein
VKYKTKSMAVPDITTEAIRPGPRLQASRGILLTQCLRLAVRLGTAAGMARLLTPKQYGIFGMALLFHGIATVVQDFGLGTVLLRKPRLPEGERNAFFWMNAVGGAVLALLVASAGPAVAVFYREPQLRWLLPGLSLTLLLNGLHTQLRAQLAREGRFTDLNHIDIVAFVASSGLALAAAWIGAAVWALVILLVASEALTAVGAWRVQRWRPGRPPSEFSVVTFSQGLPLSGYELLRYAQRNTDQFFVSRWLGAADLGLYGRAIQLVTLPGQYLCEPLAAWAVSTLAALQDSPSAARAFWGRIVNGLAHLTLPFAVMIFWLPAEILHVFFGPAWISGAPILRGLTGLIVAQPLLVAEAWVLIAAGHSKRLLAWSAANLVAMVAVSAILINFGAAAVATGISAVLLVSATLGAAIALQGLPAQTTELVKSLVRPLALATAATTAIIVIFRFDAVENVIVRLALGAAATVACWGGGWAWRGARDEMRNHFLLHRS